VRHLDFTAGGQTRLALRNYESEHRSTLSERYPLGYALYAMDGQSYSPPPILRGLQAFRITPGLPVRLKLEPRDVRFRMPAILNRASTVELEEVEISLPRRDGVVQRHPLSNQLGCDAWAELHLEPDNLTIAVVGLKETPGSSGTP